MKYSYLSPILRFKIIEPKPQFVECPGEVDVIQRLHEWHMDEEFEPAGLSRCDELVEELSDMNCERVKHPGDGEDGPLGVVVVTVTAPQMETEGVDVCAYVYRWQH